MLRNAFFKSLRDQARPLIMWVIGVAFYVALLDLDLPEHQTQAARCRATSTACRRRPRRLPGARRRLSSPVGYVNGSCSPGLRPSCSSPSPSPSPRVRWPARKRTAR